jgi:hypothetical protein
VRRAGRMCRPAPFPGDLAHNRMVHHGEARADAWAGSPRARLRGRVSDPVPGPWLAAIEDRRPRGLRAKTVPPYLTLSIDRRAAKPTRRRCSRLEESQYSGQITIPTTSRFSSMSSPLRVQRFDGRKTLARPWSFLEVGSRMCFCSTSRCRKWTATSCSR